MKDTTETRLKLTQRMRQGQEAQSLLKKLDPKFVELRELYRGNLVHSVRTGAEMSAVYQEACRISALEDLYQTLYQEAVTGARAQDMATELEKAKSEATK